MSFVWLEWANKTPMDLGICTEDVDPIWWDGVMMVRAGWTIEQRQKMGSHG